MSFSDDSSDAEWKETKMKTAKVIKQEQQNAAAAATALNKAKYSQRFCDKWLTIFHPWLARCEDEDNKPFCRACQCRLDCNRCHLQRHEKTTKHARNLEILVNKGEGAARQNLNIRQERSKYYQQRKKQNSSLGSSTHDASDLGMETAEDYIEEYDVHQDAAMPAASKTDPDAETSFQFVQTETAPGDQYTEETIMKQETQSADGHGDPLPPTARSTPKTRGVVVSGAAKKAATSGSGGITTSGSGGAVIKKERMKLFMQIQKDKNDLMDSFKELMGGGQFQQHSPPREKNHVDLFFESVSSSVKALSPKLIAETKMRVSQLICELELRALTENDVAHTTSVATAVTSGAAQVMVPETGNTYVISPPVTTVVHGVHHQQSAQQQQQQQHHHQTGIQQQQHYETLS